MRCQPCWERKKEEHQAVKDVMGTPMCKACFTGIPDVNRQQPIFQEVGRPKVPSETALRIVCEFMPHAKKQYCACGQPRAKGQAKCVPCKQFTAKVIWAKSRLRNWMESGNHRALADAARMIEKARIQPEDFMRS